MSEWLIRCTDDLKSGAYYVGVDIHDGEQPVMILFKKDGEKTFVVGQGNPVNPHGDLIDLDELGSFPYNMDFCDGYEADEWVHNAPVVIPASEEVYANYTDTAGNLHWTGTVSGAHTISASE